jgi:threonine dehydrogenase-like Zn-dependent dehydrogenase
MKALIWEAPRQMAMRDEPEPQLLAGEVLLKVAYAGICGSELSGYLGHNSLRVPPLIMGHEFSGEVVAVEEDVNGLEIGQHVTVNPLLYCGHCVYCQQGLNQLCVNRRLLGGHRPGAFAEYISVPAPAVSLLPEGFSSRLGALTEPVACAMRIGELAGSVEGAICLVIGAGPIGLLATQVLMLNGAAQVLVSELDEHRSAMAAALGGVALDPREVDVTQTVCDATEGLGASVSLDAVGTAQTRAQCVQATQATGTMILSGLHREVSEMPVADIIRREITVKGSFAYSPANFAQALNLLAEGKIRLDPWIVEAPLADGGQWFDRLLDAPGNVSKVLLIP